VTTKALKKHPVVCVLPVAPGVFVASEAWPWLVLALMEHGQKL